LSRVDGIMEWLDCVDLGDRFEMRILLGFIFQTRWQLVVLLRASNDSNVWNDYGLELHEMK